jgi:acetyl esterase/lipase
MPGPRGKENSLRKIVFAFTLAFAAIAIGQQMPAQWAAGVADNYRIYPDIAYGFQSNTALKLDLWQNNTGAELDMWQTKSDRAPFVPTVIYIHGGGWLFGDRTGAVPELLPWIARGWNVLNVEYRMSGNSLAPAAVEDCRCALRWLYRNAQQYRLDLNHIIVTGHSAGGHLALMTGMATSDSGLDNECPGTEDLKVSAIVNWYGISDVADLLHGPDTRNYALQWLGSMPDRMEIAKLVSPLTYVRPGLPPIISIQGDADSVVPYSNSLRLQQALDKAGDINELITIRGGGHGQFGAAESEKAYARIFAFLGKNVPGLSTN